ncbi:MAG: hypothetical protein HGA42_20060, partial [Nostocales cyanobacterium W4_Combined_metabat2_030]|nr:hypothetical protein [Nostocales cyanobacterium W4_Combined_metabat2_030]
MLNNSKTPDRLYITAKNRAVVEKIDEDAYFGLGKNMISRSELFLFAMALGYEVGTKMEFKDSASEGLVLDKSVDSTTKSLIYAQFIAGITDEDLDKISRKDIVYGQAEQYANTRFSIL